MDNRKQREREEAELMAFAEEHKSARKALVKRILIIIVCLGLVLAFCLPSLASLL